MIELNEKREMQQRYLLLQRGPSPGEGHGHLSPAQHSCPRALQCLVARKTQERCCKESCAGFFSCREVLSLCHRSIGAQEALIEDVFVCGNAHTSLHLSPGWTEHPTHDKAVSQMYIPSHRSINMLGVFLTE